MVRVQIEALLLRTVEMNEVTPETLKQAKDELILDHGIEDCQFVARWKPEGKMRHREQVIP